MANDELTGIFDNLHPSQFETRTAAVSEGLREGQTYDEFIADQLRSVRYAFAAANGKIDPLATLTNGKVEKVFAANDDESLGDYIDRLQAEARDMQATRLFIYKITMVGIFEDGSPYKEKPTAVNDPNAMEAAKQNGSVMEALYWYSEDHSEEEQEMRHGFMPVDGYSLGDLVPGNQEQTLGAFARILRY